METSGTLDKEWIAEYKRASVARRAARRAASNETNVSSQQNEHTAAYKDGREKGKVIISYDGGHVTVDTSNATPIPANADKSAIFGCSSISICTFDLHRSKTKAR